MKHPHSCSSTKLFENLHQESFLESNSTQVLMLRRHEKKKQPTSTGVTTFEPTLKGVLKK